MSSHAAKSKERPETPRVLFLTRKWPPAVGGMEVYSFELAKALHGHTDLEVLALPGQADGKPPKPAALLAFGFKALRRLAWRRQVYDAVLIGDLAMSPLAIWLRLTGFRGRVIVAAHGTDIAYKDRPGLAPFLYRTMLRAVVAARGAISAIVANSAATAERCRGAGFARIETVPLGVDAADRPLPPGTDPSRDLVFVGRVMPRKGVGWFVREVLPHLPGDMRLRVVGTIWSDEERRILEASDRVDLVGPRFGKELDRERAQAMAVIVPNVHLGNDVFEGFGLVAVETSAMGGVLLASRIDGIVDAVADGETGFLLPSGEAEAWIDKITEVSAWDPSKRHRFVRQAVDRTRDLYSWDRVARQYVSLLTGAPDETEGSRL